MIRARELEKKLLTRIRDGQKIGVVRDIYLDGEARRVAAVLVGKEGWIDRTPLVIKSAQVQSYEGEALRVTADKATPLHSIPQNEQYMPVSNLRGRRVQTEGGDVVGTLDDVILEDYGGVIGFTLDKVRVGGPISERRAIPRHAVKELGGRSSPMITILQRAESMRLTDQG